MNGLSKIASKSSVAALALTVGLTVGDVRSARAQACDPPGAAAVAAGGTIVPQILTSATNIISGIASSFNTFIGPVTGALSDVEGVAGGCIDLTSCMQMYFSQLASTNTNNQTMSSSIIAKGNDYLATNQYALQLQGQQAQLAVENGVGTGQNGNSLAYMNNDLCVTTTMASGAAEASYEADSGMEGNPWPAGDWDSTPPAPSPNNPTQPVAPGNPSGTRAFTPTISSVQQVNAMYRGAQPFIGTDVTSNRDVDLPYLDTLVEFGPKGAQNKVDDATAMAQYINYILGATPEVPPASATDQSGQQATVAEREKMAYYNTALMAFKEETAYRNPTKSLAATFVQQVYSAAGLGVPSGGISKEELMDVMYRQTAEDPETYHQLSGMQPSKVLEYLTGLTLLGNDLNYERYKIERQNLLVNSAALALAYRNENFASHP